MTVALLGTSATFTGTGASALYTPNFSAISAEQVKVTVDGTLTTAYTLSGLGGPGSIGVTGNFASGAAVVVYRDTPLTQEQDIENNETVLEDALELPLDKLTMLAQEQAGALLRTLRVPRGETIAELPAAAARASRYLGFSSLGALVLSTAEQVVASTPVAVISASGQSVSTRGLLAGIVAPVNGQTAYLSEAGRQGWFKFSTADNSANVTADPQQGIYVAPASDPDGSSGAWVRQYGGAITPELFGAVGDGASDDTAAMRGCIVAAQAALREVRLTAGKTYRLVPVGGDAQAVLLPLTVAIRLYGNGAKIKIGAGTPGYAAIIGSGDAAVDLTGLHIEGVEFDHNATNTSNFTVGNVHGAGVLDSARATVIVKRGTSFTFENNIVRNAACTNSIIYSGDGNTSNCNIAFNHFLDIGDTPNGVYHDHSTLYPTGENIKVVGNTFKGASWGVEGAVCAIEVHPGTGCIISGNRIEKYHTGINYAGIYEADSREGVIDGNVMETLRHGIVLFSTAYLTHNNAATHFGIDGLEVFGNGIRIRNATSKGSMTGGQAGVGGIVTNSSNSLPMRDVDVYDNDVVYDVETVASDYTGTLVALGVLETTLATSYERVNFHHNRVVNAPGLIVVMGDGGGHFKHCNAYPNDAHNPMQSASTITAAGRRGYQLVPNDVTGYLKIGGKITGGHAGKLYRPMTCACANSATDARVVFRVDVDWATAPSAQGDFRDLTKYDNNIAPQVFYSTTGVGGSLGDFGGFGAAQLLAGSEWHFRDTNVRWQWLATGTAVVFIMEGAGAPADGGEPNGSRYLNRSATAGQAFEYYRTGGVWKALTSIAA